jgi:hypothetical protein
MALELRPSEKTTQNMQSLDQHSMAKAVTAQFNLAAPAA